MPPSNITFETATTISSFPFDFTQTDINDGGVNFTVFYRFIAPAGARVVGAWGFSGNIGSGYRPNLQPFNGPASSPTFVLSIFSQNKPIQFPVIPGNEYFLRFAKNIDTAGPEDIRVRVEIAPQAVSLVDSIMIHDDTTGFPMAALSKTLDNTVNGFVNDIAAGEAGDILASGVFALEEASDNTIKIYSPSFNLIVQTPVQTGTIRIRGNRGTNRFWIGISENPAKAKYLTQSGVFGTQFTLTGNAHMESLAANNDETILYFANLGFGVPLKRWDLVLNSAMSDLAPILGDYQIPDIIVLADGTILALYRSNSTNDVQVKRYNFSGTVLNTYSLGIQGGGTMPRMSYSPDNPLSFWVFTHNSVGQSIFRNVRVSDGAILTTRTQTEYEGGVFVGAETATPPSRFGNSFSCTIFIMEVGDNPFSGIYVLEVGKRNDTLYSSLSPVTTENRKIPDPTYRTAKIGE